MINSDIPVYLASKSPRRKKLLEQLNLKFKTLSVECEEKIIKGEKPSSVVKRLSLEKLESAIAKIQNGIIITADTIVVIDGKIIGKPINKKDAALILLRLSGRTHKVYTGFSIYNSRTKNVLTDYEKTLVTFRKLNNKEIQEYINQGSPMDKAGAYGIQDDYGAVFVSKINGCYNNVVGLPLTKLYANLLKIL
ncbi:MAG TPA: Maf family protein [Ignavibacteriaceae bacterium]|nr:Maf family protein [Ignavibacteriaceae bacterium]